MTNIARAALGGNALFTTAAAAYLLARPHVVAELMLRRPPEYTWMIVAGLGVGLLIFAAWLVKLGSSRELRRSQVSDVVGADIMWVVATAAILVLAGGWFTPPGVRIMLVIAAIVGMFAVAQWLGAARLRPALVTSATRWADGRALFSAERFISGPPSAVWPLITDHDRFARAAENLSGIRVVSGSGLGMERQCYDKHGRCWSERCVRWEPGESYRFNVNTSAPDYPFPFASMTGNFSVSPQDRGSLLSVVFEVEPRRGWPTVGLRVMAGRTEEALTRLVDRWARAMDAEFAK